MTASDVLTLKEAYGRFILRKKVANVSPATFKFYDMCFRCFTEYAGQGRLCGDGDEDTLLDYIGHLAEHGRTTHAAYTPPRSESCSSN